MAQPAGGQQFDLMSLPFAQLQQVKKQMEGELEELTDAYAQLKMSQKRFLESKESLDSLKPANEGKFVEDYCFLID